MDGRRNRKHPKGYVLPCSFKFAFENFLCIIKIKITFQIKKGQHEDQTTKTGIISISDIGGDNSGELLLQMMAQLPNTRYTFYVNTR